ncbi:MAG: hypothetical protein RL154_773 [Pseudomonadota bacterium]|jgi:PPK2 family polyphosphate:nucleotide phosphotransferase
MATVKPKIESAFDTIVVDKAKKIKLENFNANFENEKIKVKSKKEAHEKAAQFLEESKEELIEAQAKLWADKKYGFLIVLQGLDTAGKDGTIKHILSGVNPQGCRIEAFKTPTADEHLHTYLWRYQKVAPRRGEIVVFNRSHYEDILVTKVHPNFMEPLPEKLNVDSSKSFWENRYEDINAWEKHLARNGILVLKFFLHISQDEQTKRLLERLSIDEKLWKVSPADLKERNFWDDYIKAYEDCIENTSAEHAPWIVVPANDKKVARAIIAHIIADSIQKLDIDFPKLSKEEIEELRKAKIALESEAKK